MNLNSITLSLALSAAIAGAASAQTSGPPASAPGTISTLYTPVFGVTAGIALTLGGLVEYAVAGQPYALRGELIYQRFALKSDHAGSSVNLTSLGATLVLKNSATPSNTFLTAGIAIYNGTDVGTRPGINGGGGIEIPLTGFSATGEARLHLVLADGRPVLTLPLTVGIRF
jgi:hypothetical protein